MQLTTLDVLIITFLATPKRFLSKAPGVELPRSVFEVHSQFVKRSLLFTKVIQKDVVRISIAEHSLHNDPRQKPGRMFAQKCSYWRSMYRQDRLLSFAESGFGALRLAENAELFSGLLFNKGRIAWNLQADTCYINGKPQPGSGIKWAWDLFAVSQIAARECGLKWTQFGPQLTSPHPPHIVELGFSADVNSPGTASYIPNGQNLLYCALHKRMDWAISFGPLKMVTGSKKITLSRHPVHLVKKNGKALNLLEACMIAQSSGKVLSIEEAFNAMCNGRTKHRRNNNICRHGKGNTLGQTSDALNTYGREVTELDIDEKIKMLRNARDTIQDAINGSCNENKTTSKDDDKITYKILISKEKDKVELIRET